MSAMQLHPGTKIMIGHRLRRLRKRLGLNQSDMADQIGISPSYFNLLENNARPVTVQVLLRLSQSYDIDLRELTDDESARLIARLIEIFADPALNGIDLSRRDMQQLAESSPQAAEAFLRLYSAYESMKSAAQKGQEGLESRRLPEPASDVQVFLEKCNNHFPELEEAADESRTEAKLESGRTFERLSQYVLKTLGIETVIMQIDVMQNLFRKYDFHRKRIMLSEVLEAPQLNFQLAVQFALLAHSDLINSVMNQFKSDHPIARKLLRSSLANYLAGAMLMPYDTFLEAAQDSHHDLYLLCRRFGASFEQVCHRLTTLNKPAKRGIPFFFLRVNEAGYISKRLSAGGMAFALHGGGCGRWIPHQAFRSPDQFHVQFAELEDGQKLFTMARTVIRPRTGPGQYGAPRVAVALGCDIKYVKNISLANRSLAGGLSGIRTGKKPRTDKKGNAPFEELGDSVFVPIGMGCGLCERTDCQHRGSPPLGHELLVDPNSRSAAMYAF